MKNIIEEIHKLQRKKRNQHIRDKIFLLEMEDLFTHLPFFENVLEVKYFPWITESDEFTPVEQLINHEVWNFHPQMLKVVLKIGDHINHISITKNARSFDIMTQGTGEFLKSRYLKSLKRKMNIFDFRTHFLNENERFKNDEKRRYNMYIELNDAI